MSLRGKTIKETAATFHLYLTERHKNTLLVCWIVLSCLILAIDYSTGSVIQFPFMFIVPVGLAAWYSGAWSGLAFAFVLPLIRLYFTTIFSMPWGFPVSVANAAIRIVILVGYALLIAYIAKQKKGLEREINILEGILPVCSFVRRFVTSSVPGSQWRIILQSVRRRFSATAYARSVKRNITVNFFGSGKEMAQSK
jgi:hypothetical protein